MSAIFIGAVIKAMVLVLLALLASRQKRPADSSPERATDLRPHPSDIVVDYGLARHNIL